MRADWSAFFLFNTFPIMKYLLHSLDTVTQCEALLSKASDQLSKLIAKKLFAQHIISRFSDLQRKRKTDLQNFTAELAMLEPISWQHPSGKTR